MEMNIYCDDDSNLVLGTIRVHLLSVLNLLIGFTLNIVEHVGNIYSPTSLSDFACFIICKYCNTMLPTIALCVQKIIIIICALPLTLLYKLET